MNTIKITAAAILALTATACQSAGAMNGGGALVERGEFASGTSPAQYRQTATVLVTFSTDVRSDCEKLGLAVTREEDIEGCSVIGGDRPHLILPMPYRRPIEFARITGHELAHANGWGEKHGH